MDKKPITYIEGQTKDEEDDVIVLKKAPPPPTCSERAFEGLLYAIYACTIFGCGYMVGFFHGVIGG